VSRGDPTTPVYADANYASCPKRLTMSVVRLSPPRRVLAAVTTLSSSSATALAPAATGPATATTLQAVVGEGDVGPAAVGEIGAREGGKRR
jgi:hypothetical protein